MSLCSIFLKLSINFSRYPLYLFRYFFYTLNLSVFTAINNLPAAFFSGINCTFSTVKKETDVETGISNATEIQIVSGLSEGDEVVVK